MTRRDTIILLKKIFIGIIVFLVPLLIFFLGLWLVRAVF